MATAEGRRGERRIRYAVVGQGHISQAAVLPAFAHAQENSELCALVSEDPRKLRELAARYHVARTCSYEEYDDLLRSGDVDAVYIALPNSMHRDYAERAALAGVHVLCEKPMALTEEDCEAMIRAAMAGGIKLMIAYRLHFEEANLRAIDLVASGTLGEPRLFLSALTQQVEEGNVRLSKALGGGTLYDLGVYCINAARNLFRDEPIEAFAQPANSGEPRFGEVDEMTAAVLRFPGDRLASFTCSFGAAEVSSYRIVGTVGDLRVEPAYELSSALCHHLNIGGKTEERRFDRRDQFAPELLYFSRCVLEDREPEPSGVEGLADVRVIRALQRSAQIGQSVRLGGFEKKSRPSLAQEIRRPPVEAPDLVHAGTPSGRG